MEKAIDIIYSKDFVFYWSFASMFKGDKRVAKNVFFPFPCSNQTIKN